MKIILGCILLLLTSSCVTGSRLGVSPIVTKCKEITVSSIDENITSLEHVVAILNNRLSDDATGSQSPYRIRIDKSTIRISGLKKYQYEVAQKAITQFQRRFEPEDLPSYALNITIRNGSLWELLQNIAGKQNLRISEDGNEIILTSQPCYVLKCHKVSREWDRKLLGGTGGVDKVIKEEFIQNGDKSIMSYPILIEYLNDQKMLLVIAAELDHKIIKAILSYPPSKRNDLGGCFEQDIKKQDFL